MLATICIWNNPGFQFSSGACLVKKFLSCLLFLPLLAWADSAELVSAGHEQMTRLIQHIRVAEDFTYEQEIDAEYKALTEQGARSNGRFPIAYNKAFSEMEIVLAETIKADGRHVPVPPSGIARQSGSLGLYVQKDLEFVTLALPDFTAGDSARIVQRLRSKPIFPGSFSFAYAPKLNLVQDDTEVHLDVPAKLALRLDVEGFSLLQDEVVGARRKLAWRYSSTKAKALEAQQTDARMTQAHVWVSSMASWDAMAATYREMYLPQATVTPEIAALARTLTIDAGTDREKAQRLYDWVRKNIRYVAIYAGLEGWVPHPASQVLVDRFGDCKDHAVLLDALLKAVGIEAVPVLIQSDLINYRLPQVAVPQQFFNHMISYLPGLDLYLDSTSVFTEFGRLPDGDQGKEVLRAGLAKAVGTTPASKAENRQSKRTTKIEVNEDGSARVVSAVRFKGDYLTWYEQFHQQIGNGKEDAWAMQQLSVQKKRGRATFKWLPEADGWRGFVISQRIENFLPESEIGLLEFSHAYVGGVSILPILDLFESKSRKSSFNCMATDIRDTVEITLPENLKLLRLPRSQKLTEAVASLQVNYAERNGRYVMTRAFQWEAGVTGSCQEADWEAWQKSMRRMRSAVMSAVLAYERN